MVGCNRLGVWSRIFWSTFGFGGGGRGGVALSDQLR